MLGKKIIIVHFRVGKTDGVSLEIGAWQEMLGAKGAEVRLCGGDQSIGADYVVPHFENQLDPEVYAIDENAFGGLKDMSQMQFVKNFEKLQKKLLNSFTKVIKKAKPDAVIVSNVFSVGENIASARALLNALDTIKCPTLLINHDFYWENARYDKPSLPLITKELKECFPPERDYMRYATINSIARDALQKRINKPVSIIPDTLDFSKRAQKDPYYWDILKGKGVKDGDLIALQATRVVRRKNIELSIDFVNEFSTNLRRNGPVRLYNGREFDMSKNKVVLVASGYAEKRDEKYLAQLIKYAEQKNVFLITLNGELPNEDIGLNAILKLNHYADFITYPSEYEGFGNQFLEAIYSQKPIVVFDYPVLLRDILPKGFKTVSLGSVVKNDPETLLSKVPKRVLTKASTKMLNILTSPKKYNAIVKHNFSLGKQYFSYSPTLHTITTLLTTPAPLSVEYS